MTLVANTRFGMKGPIEVRRNGPQGRVSTQQNDLYLANDGLLVFGIRERGDLLGYGSRGAIIRGHRGVVGGRHALNVFRALALERVVKRGGGRIDRSDGLGLPRLDPGRAQPETNDQREQHR